MEEGNQTSVAEFILLGPSQDLKIQILLFCVFLIIYFLSTFGNLLIIILIQTHSQLHAPMYFFLKNLLTSVSLQALFPRCWSTSL